LRSFDEVDGFRRMSDLIEIMKPVAMTDGNLRHKVFTGKDERIIRVIKKVVRGLCQYHNIIWPISDQRVWVDILKYQVPTNLLNQMQYHHREQDIAEYHYQIFNDSEINSAWLITFFQRVTFIGLVTTSESGFS